jgi:hypothetical protein
MADQYPCQCRKNVSKTKNDRYRTHTDGAGEPCEMSSVEIPKHILEQGPVSKQAPADVPVEGVDYAQCPQCTRKVKLTRLGYFEPHDATLRGGDRCPVSGVRYEHARKLADVPLPGDALGASPAPKVKDSSTPAANRGITSPAPTSMNADAESSPSEPPPSDGSEIDWSDVAAKSPIDWSKVGDLKHLPNELEEKEAAEEQAEREELARLAGSSASTEMNSPESATTSTLSPVESVLDPVTEPAAEPDGIAGEVFSLGVTISDRFLQPASPFLQPPVWTEPPLVFLQPPEYEGPVKGEPMGELAKELATQVKETFYAYSNRKTTDNRSAQTTLGPSEIGTLCDRRLAMSLMGVPPVNPGGDGWAAFVGTCTHAGMAEVYTFADAGTGRYAVELPVFLGSPTVPRGTTDLLDRRPGVVIDWKVMGDYSLKKFKREGPSATYRVQAHVYGLGAERSGEKVRNVAIIGLPRAGRSLDEMHVWTEKFDKKFAQAALDRVEKIANEIATLSGLAAIGETGVTGPMAAAAEFEPADDCTYCPFYLKGDKEMVRGCPGK